MTQKEIHFKKLASKHLSSNYIFYCNEDSNKMLHFSIKKSNVVSSLSIFPAFMEDSFFLEHLFKQINAVDKMFAEYN